ncbi:M3 family oligoendopeptidase [Clostridium sp. KNHs216]|uniref:M3 family oligoendopeptidase n=1 Tax=Clostridium sp. KNHs216 TaxID=1550235 RepID=UPI0011509C97|nr:M3 family oligoendopeptidase [Clostridium sp. KNHs216]TQI66276.1 hypothetical protein LY85_0937 [Clostridium sp. KNHs216]TQI69018.1 hypothetical protein LY85_3767 [Clostridium sp. KNHs216]
MITNYINLNNVWTEVLMIQSDTERSYGSVIEDGDKRYNVSPFREWQEDSKYHYWFIINSIEIINPELLQKINELQAENDILGQTAAQLQLDNMQLNSTVDTLGATVAQLQLENIAAKGGAS